jgi:hypothetical protein
MMFGVVQHNCVAWNPRYKLQRINSASLFSNRLSFSGLGGTFLLKEGKARQHIMPDFSATPINTDEEVEKWLHFYNMSAPLIAVGTLASADPVSWYTNYHL